MRAKIGMTRVTLLHHNHHHHHRHCNHHYQIDRLVDYDHHNYYDYDDGDRATSESGPLKLVEVKEGASQGAAPVVWDDKHLINDHDYHPDYDDDCYGFTDYDDDFYGLPDDDDYYGHDDDVDEYIEDYCYPDDEEDNYVDDCRRAASAVNIIDYL